MRVLVLGGTRFLGWAVVSEALARGDSVTTFTRGVSGSPPAGVEAVHGDRTDPAALAQLRGREFGLVVDTSGYVPAVVGAGARLLADSVGHYTFVSTRNVYPGWPAEPTTAASRVHDGTPDATQAPPELTGAEPYGWLKSGCERAVEAAFPGRCTQVRAGFIVGPHDNNGRVTHWLGRIAQGGRVPVPGTPDRPFAAIDARDLARWMLDPVPGVFNATGPSDMSTYGEFFGAMVEATGSGAELVWVPEEIIAAVGIRPFVELPLWLPTSVPHLFDIDVAPIFAAGLVQRPIATTIADTWAWLRGTDDLKLELMGTPEPGLSPEREAALLAAADQSRRSA